MGSNGSHAGLQRTSAFALATTRKDGYASLSGTGMVVTTPIRCTGSQLTVTADFGSGGGLLKMRVLGSKLESTPLRANGTDLAVDFAGGGSLTHLVGQMVSLGMELRGCSVYTVGFANASAVPGRRAR